MGGSLMRFTSACPDNPRRHGHAGDAGGRADDSGRRHRRPPDRVRYRPDPDGAVDLPHAGMPHPARDLRDLHTGEATTSGFRARKQTSIEAPNWNSRLRPQHHSSEVRVTAQACSAPRVMPCTGGNPSTRIGNQHGSLLPSRLARIVGPPAQHSAIASNHTGSPQSQTDGRHVVAQRLHPDGPAGGTRRHPVSHETVTPAPEREVACSTTGERLADRERVHVRHSGHVLGFERLRRGQSTATDAATCPGGTDDRSFHPRQRNTHSQCGDVARKCGHVPRHIDSAGHTIPGSARTSDDASAQEVRQPCAPLRSQSRRPGHLRAETAPAPQRTVRLENATVVDAGRDLCAKTGRLILVAGRPQQQHRHDECRAGVHGR